MTTFSSIDFEDPTNVYAMIMAFVSMIKSLITTNSFTTNGKYDNKFHAIAIVYFIVSAIFFSTSIGLIGFLDNGVIQLIMQSIFLIISACLNVFAHYAGYSKKTKRMGYNPININMD
jgi:hypothetical protein